MDNELENAYKYCESVTKTHARSFYFAAKFLPKHKQRPIYALYALCRSVDDEVDEAEVSSETEAIRAVERWKEKLNAVYTNDEKLRITNYELRNKENRPQINTDKPGLENKEQKTNDEGQINNRQNLVLLAWRDLLQNYKIPQNLPLELMKGVLQDTHIKRYETFDELYVYCWRVASTVGLMSSEIFGYEKPETLKYAEALGIAMQLTNILRDIKEDAAMSRIYLPLEDLRKFNISEKQISAGEMSANFVDLMKFQIERARHYYAESYRGIALLAPETRFTVLLALRIYSRILDQIERQNYDVFQKRAHTSFRQKVFSVPRVWLEARNF